MDYEWKGRSQDADGEPNFKWDVKDLEYHVEMNMFEKRLEIDHVALPPFWLSNPLKGVSEELEENLGHWKSSLNGYLVAFDNIEYNGTKIADMYVDQPWLHLDIRATFYTYKPSVDQVLKGIIKKVVAKAALCVVFNCFAATVFPLYPEELNMWTIGCELEFKVTTVQNRRKGPVIRATSCGNDPTTKYLEVPSSQTCESVPERKKSGKNKKRKIEGKEINEEGGERDEEREGRIEVRVEEEKIETKEERKRRRKEKKKREGH